MSVEQEVANLTLAINTLTSTVNVRKAVLDAAVDEAEDHADQALGYKNEAAAKAIEATDQAANAGATKALMDAALANVTNYDNTLGQLTGGAKRVVAQTDVVAAFVYDTTKDSDRGTWRKRCRQTSWYNEALNTATRGTRREFPKKALIVARAASVTIHDMDDAACPMWMVFSAATTSQHARSTAVSAAILANGILVIGGNQGVARVDFIRDFSVFSNNSYSGSWTDGRVVSRNGDTAVAAGSAYGLIAAIQVNGVASTVLPGTPVDKRRGLPTPTMAVATAGGVSVIHWDGRVANSTFANSIGKTGFAADGTLWFAPTISNPALLFSPATEFAVAGFASRYYSSTSGYPNVSNGDTTALALAGTRAVKGTVAFGLNVLDHIPGSGFAANQQSNRASIACLTTKYNTGYLAGDVKLALAASTADVTSLVAYSLLDDFSSYADDTALNAVYTSISGATLSLDTGRLKITNGAGAGVARRLWANNLTVGQRYEWAVDLTGGTAGVDVRFASTQGGNNYGTATFTDAGNSATRTGSFVAISSDLWIDARTSAPASGTGFFDNFRLKAVASDRSVAGNHPTVVGTVTRAAVASGAELAAYGGFSTSNFLRHSNSNGAFNFGTGDFAISLWLKKGSNTLVQFALELCPPGNDTKVISIYTTATNGYLGGWVDDGGAGAADLKTSYSILNDGRFHHAVLLRRSGTIEFWVDGGQIGTSSRAGDLTISGSILTIGCRSYSDTSPGADMLIALPRVSLTAPTPAQIRAMYEAERGLFEANAKCLLLGSDNVQGLAYDDSTDLLYVAKAAGGTDVFKGLVRHSSMTISTENALGPEIIVNGGFTADTDFTKGTGVTISGGLLNLSSTPNNSGAIQAHGGAITPGKSYLVSFDVVSISSGSFRPLIAATGGTARTAVGSYAEIIVAGAGASCTLAASGATTGSADNFSVREITSLRLASNNHKAVHAADDHVTIATDAEAFARLPSVGLREASLGHNGGPPLYDRTVARQSAVTTNATPTVIARFPMDKGERGEWIIRTHAKEYADGSEMAAYEDVLFAHRPDEGNIAISGSSTQRVIQEVTGSMAVTVAANTTTQCIEVTATGVAAKNIEWSVEGRFAA